MTRHGQTCHYPPSLDSGLTSCSQHPCQLVAGCGEPGFRSPVRHRRALSKNCRNSAHVFQVADEFAVHSPTRYRVKADLPERKSRAAIGTGGRCDEAFATGSAGGHSDGSPAGLSLLQLQQRLQRHDRQCVRPHTQRSKAGRRVLRRARCDSLLPDGACAANRLPIGIPATSTSLSDSIAERLLFTVNSLMQPAGCSDSSG